MFFSPRFFPFVVLLLAAPIRADYPARTQTDILIQVQRLTFADKFSDADVQASAFIARWPEDPAGYLFRAAVMLAKMTDHEENLYPELFPALLDSAEVRAYQYPDSSTRTRAWMQLWIGHARAYRSIWESRFGSLTTALRKGLGAKGEYQKGLRLDSTVYDLYAGLGAYHYWKSAKAGMLRWIGIFSNDKDQGIDELKMAADSSQISRESARSALLWIYVDAGKYDSALIIARELAGAYPTGKSFLWPTAQLYFEQEMYDSALVYYRQLRQRIAQSPGNYFNLIECDFYLTRCYELLERPVIMQQSARQIDNYEQAIPKETRTRQRGKIEYLMEKSGRKRFR